MRSPRRLLLLVVLALAGTSLVSCGEKKASEKKLVTLNGEGFSVSVPGKTKRQVQGIPTAAGPIDFVSYSSADKGASEDFSVGVAQIPAKISFDLDGAVRSAAANVQGKVSKVTKTTYQGFPERDARVTGAQDKNGHKGTVFARLIFAKHQVLRAAVHPGGRRREVPARGLRDVPLVAEDHLSARATNVVPSLDELRRDHRREHLVQQQPHPRRAACPASRAALLSADSSSFSAIRSSATLLEAAGELPHHHTDPFDRVLIRPRTPGRPNGPHARSSLRQLRHPPQGLSSKRRGCILSVCGA